MSDTYVVEPPDLTVWWVPEATRDAVAARLRIASTGDIDTARIEMLIPAAGQRINEYLDRVAVEPPAPPDPVPSSWQAALEELTVRLYFPQEKNADGSISDPILAVAGLLRKERWGVA